MNKRNRFTLASRRKFILRSGAVFTALLFPFHSNAFDKYNSTMEDNFDVIIIGGSYSGLAAAMALGRALKKVLVIDSGEPCNRYTPHSHNFITQDGKPPQEIAALARKQVQEYGTVKFFNGTALATEKKGNLFQVFAGSNAVFNAKKLIFATGIRDLMVDIAGFEQCWGKSVIHCPYCHGYEVRNEPTGILGNGEYAFEFASLISNWTNDLTVFTNGKSSLTIEQAHKLVEHNIDVVEDEIGSLVHSNGYLQKIIFKNGSLADVIALYARPHFIQNCNIPESLGCELTPDGYLKIDSSQRTTIPGIFACGDNTTRMRTVANAVAMGTTAGMMVNKELIIENF
jgi:thioredoxin reductase